MFKFVISSALILAVVSAGFQPLTPENVQKLKSWKEGDQNMWQLSGQYQGDMVLLPGQRNGVVDTRLRWPNYELPYEFDGSVGSDQRAAIESALRQYSERSCMRTRPRTSSDNDYVYVTAENTGCWSYVGRIGGRQQLNLQNPGCHPTGTIVHEFLHAFGFYHMQSATNRDDYVQIMWANIQSGTEHNFDVYGSDMITEFGERYDYSSVMHYDRYAFSSNGQPTIVPHDPNAQIGQRDGLSDIDIAKLEKMYGCRK